MKERKQFTLTCSDCEKEIRGFSQKHVELNLYIHKQTSKKHEYIVKLLKKRGYTKSANVIV